MEQKLEKQIQQILERNEKVEKNKAWETSWTRRFCIALVTFVCAFLFLKMIGAEKSLLAAVVPTAGFLLSSLSLNSVRKIWEKWYNKERN